MKLPSPLQKLSHPTHHLYIKRDDLIHPIICGNKRRKISGYLQQHPETNQIITFGGAYSNHLRAIARTGRLFDIKTVGIIRGDELAHKPLNDSLQSCQDDGMQLVFTDRKTYKTIKHSTQPEQITPYQGERDSHTLVIPEGGCGPEGLIGTHAIIHEIAEIYTHSSSVYFCLEAGTGTTAAGCIQAIQSLGLNWRCLIIPVLHDLPHITATIHTHNPDILIQTNSRKLTSTPDAPVTLITGYEHGGYAKNSPELLQHNTHRMDLHHMYIEPIYSGKLMYAVDDLIDRGLIPHSATTIIYHSGY